MAEFPVAAGLRLGLARAQDGGPYPTARLQTGLLLADGDRLLAEEGVGFGVPVVKRGPRTVFPGTRRASWLRQGTAWQVRIVYRLDLVERLVRADGAPVGAARLYAARDLLAALHRRVPVLRGPLTALSAGVRSSFALVTAFEPAETAGVVVVRYGGGTRTDRVTVDVDLRGLRCEGLTEAVVMNEQGATPFARYRDSNGVELVGSRIESWHLVRAGEAAFVDPAHGLEFRVRQVAGARLYRGREQMDSRLAWSGFGYSAPPEHRRLTYEIVLRRTR